MAVPTFLLSTGAKGTINGPYSVDNNTFGLYHLDEAAGASTAVNSQTQTSNLIGFNQPTATAAGTISTAILGSGGFTGFNNAATFSGNLLLGYDGNANATYDPDLSTNTTTPAADAIAASNFTDFNNGAYTLDALIKTPSLAYANSTNHEIVSFDSSYSAAASRGFQFRLNVSNTGAVRLEYNNISKAGSDTILAVPTSGADAYALNTWYHVAMVYTGGNTAGNVRLYWTKLDPNDTYAHLLGTGLSAGNVASPANMLVVGNENRNTAGEAFGGLIDEVRLSNTARNAFQFVFGGATANFWQTNSGDWDTAGNWSSGTVPNLVQADASFSINSPVPPTADSTVTLSGTKTLGTMTFDTAPFNFTLASGASGALSFNNGGTPSSITVISGNQTIAVPVAMTSDGLAIAAGAGASLTVSGNLSGAGTINNSGGGTLVISGTLGNTGGLNNSGSGTATVSGAATSTGGLTNSGSGTLNVTGTVSLGTVTNSGTGVLALTATSNSYSGATTASGGVIRADDGVGLPATTNLVLNGGALETGANFGRALGAAAGQVRITGGASGFSARGADIQVGIGGVATPANLTWGGSNFAPTALVLNNAATADHNITFLNAIDLNGQNANISVGVNNATMSGVISDSAATGTLTKSGNGTLFLTGNNSYAGTTSVTGGILVATDGAGLPATTNLLLNNGLFGSTLNRDVGSGAGQVQLSGGSAGFTAIGADTTVTLTNGGNPIPWGSASFNPATLILSSLAGTNNVNLAADLDLNDGVRTVQVNSHVATISGAISDSGIGQTGSLTKIGAATLVLTGANTYGGTTLVSAGTLQASGSGLSPNTNLSINGGFYGSTVTRTVGTAAGQIQLPGGNSGFAASGADITVTLQNGGSPVAWGSTAFNPGTLVLNDIGSTNNVTLVADLDLGGGTRTILVNSGTDTFNGSISSTGTLQVNGAGTLVLTSATGSTYSGGTNINPGTQGPGTLRAASTNALGTGTVTTGPGGNATLARLELIGGITLPNTINFSGRNNISVGIENISGNNSLSGVVSIGSGGSTYLIQSDAGTLDLAGGISSAAGGTRTVSLQGTGNGVVSGPLLNGTATVSLVKDGAGTWTLGNSGNTYSGATTVNRGLLVFANGGAFANTASITANANGGVGAGSSSLDPAFVAKINASATPSVGGLALASADSAANVDFTAAPLSGAGTVGMSVGAIGLVAYTGTITPDPALGYRLGSPGGGTLTLANANALTGARNVHVTNLGNVVLAASNDFTGSTTVDAGSTLVVQANLTTSSSVTIAGLAELASGGGSNRVLKTPALSISTGGKLNLQDNKLITQTPVGTLNGSTYSDITGMIQSGRNGGGWTGVTGIITSQSNATSGNFTSIGVATAQQVKGLANSTDTATFAGQTATGTDTLVMYTYGGDANLDGKINVDDYGRIDFNVNLGTSGWFNGDFNYDGKINVDDYGIIDFNVGIQGAPFPTGAGGGAGASAGLSGVSAVPEPATFSLVLAACGLALPRRRRRYQPVRLN